MPGPRVKNLTSITIFEKMDVHIHVPAGAIPGRTFSGSHDGHIADSALMRMPVRKDVAMTGEITLRGEYCPSGV